MDFGIYIHIPYCLQRCLYCDFATYEVNTIINPESYFQLLKEEILQRYKSIPYRKISSVYFGGGTPSLVKPQLIINSLKELANLGFQFSENTEVTIEINPGTSFVENLPAYINSPINRYSVGAQTFNDEQLSSCGRKHNTKDTYQTLDLLKKNNLNFSLDILFALPNQTFSQLAYDVKTALTFKPKHISPYYLTVPKNHIMSKNRPHDDDQLQMFEFIKNELNKHHYKQYEISNFCLDGYESNHNLTYWSDKAYWGIGLSSHSYFPKQNLRFWNPKTINSYKKLIESYTAQFSLNDMKCSLDEASFEYLQIHEQMTDFCHTHLRKNTGIPKAALRQKFDSNTVEIIVSRLEKISSNDYINENDTHWFFTNEGRTLSNLVFEKLCFSSNELN